MSKPDMVAAPAPVAIRDRHRSSPAGRGRSAELVPTSKAYRLLTGIRPVASVRGPDEAGRFYGLYEHGPPPTDPRKRTYVRPRNDTRTSGTISQDVVR